MEKNRKSDVDFDNFLDERMLPLIKSITKDFPKYTMRECVMALQMILDTLKFRQNMNDFESFQNGEEYGKD